MSREDLLFDQNVDYVTITIAVYSKLKCDFTPKMSTANEESASLYFCQIAETMTKAGLDGRQYIEQSITNPSAYLVDGFNSMFKFYNYKY